MALADNIKAAYNLSDTTDATGNGNTLTNTGSVAFSTPAKIGNAAQFTASNSKRLGVTNSLGYDTTRGNTWNLWVYVNAFGTKYWMDTETTTGTANTRIILYDGGADSKFHAFFGGNEVLTPALSTATWYMLTITMSGTGAGQCEFFLNASSLGTATMGSNGGNRNAFCIGNAQDTLTVEANGSIDIVDKWDRTLTGAEITQLYNSGAGLEYPFSSNLANLKTLDGIAKANIKTIDGIAIENVKTYNGIA